MLTVGYEKFETLIKKKY